jgi:hypothetical protein
MSHGIKTILYIENRGNEIKIPALYSAVPGSNFASDAGYPNSVFRDFFQCLEENAMSVLQTRSLPFPSSYFQIHYYQSSDP